MQKLQNLRPIVVCGVNDCMSTLVTAYMVAKTFANVGFEFEFDNLESDTKPGTDYIFVNDFPDEQDIKDMDEKDSNAMILVAENDRRYSGYRNRIKNYTNVYWITHKNQTVQGLYKALKDFGGNLSPVTIEKLKQIQCANDGFVQPPNNNFMQVSNMLLNELVGSDDDVRTNLPKIFTQLDELFSLEAHDINTIAKYLDIQETELMNNTAQQANMSVDGEPHYIVMICETGSERILEKLAKKYLSIDGEIDLVMITHTHFETGNHCVIGKYREGSDLTSLRAIPEITIDETQLEFSFTTKTIDEYFGNECVREH